MGKMLHGLGVLCSRLPWVVVAIWFVVVAAVFGAVAAFVSETNRTAPPDVATVSHIQQHHLEGEPARQAAR